MAGAARPALAGTKVRTGEDLPGDFLLRPTGHPIQDVYRYLDGKRIDDGIPQNLWRIHDELFDLEDFVEKHPGGPMWLTLTKGTDITELFEIHHIHIERARRLLNFYRADAGTAPLPPRRSPFTFKEDGFYSTLRRRVWERFGGELRQAAERPTSLGPSTMAKRFADAVVALSTSLVVLAGRAKGSVAGLSLAMAAGLVNGSFVGIGHNFIHQKEHWRRHYFDLSGRSCAEMRVHHALCHHAYTNSAVDVELQVMEPQVSFMPGLQGESYRQRAPVVLALYCMFGIPSKYAKRLGQIAAGNFQGTPSEHLSSLLPLLQLALLAQGGNGLPRALWQWTLMMVTTSTVFTSGNFLTGPHFNSSVWHQGDQLDSLDWGIYQLQTCIERSKLATEDTTRANLINTVVFGLHYLHHLFPTVDATKLSQLLPLFDETCQEFGITNETWSDSELKQGLATLLQGYQPNTRTLNGQYSSKL